MWLEKPPRGFNLRTSKKCMSVGRWETLGIIPHSKLQPTLLKTCRKGFPHFNMTCRLQPTHLTSYLFMDGTCNAGKRTDLRRQPSSVSTGRDIRGDSVFSDGRPCTVFPSENSHLRRLIPTTMMRASGPLGVQPRLCENY